MIQRPKTFATKKATPDSKSDVSFILGETEYKCVAELQGATILNFIAAADQGAGQAAAQIVPFFDSALPPKELAKFKKHLESKTEIVEMETLSDIVAYLIEVYTTSRPTQESESLDSGS